MRIVGVQCPVLNDDVSSAIEHGEIGPVDRLAPVDRAFVCIRDVVFKEEVRDDLLAHGLHVFARECDVLRGSFGT